MRLHDFSGGQGTAKLLIVSDDGKTIDLFCNHYSNCINERCSKCHGHRISAHCVMHALGSPVRYFPSAPDNIALRNDPYYFVFVISHDHILIIMPRHQFYCSIKTIGRSQCQYSFGHDIGDSNEWSFFLNC